MDDHALQFYEVIFLALQQRRKQLSISCRMWIFFYFLYRSNALKIHKKSHVILVILYNEFYENFIMK